MPEFKPLYRDSFAEAKRQNELDEWRESQNENVRCRNFLDEQTRQYYNNDHIDSEDIIRNAVAEFGYDRTMHVLASHVQHYDYDGRFSSQNKAWAQEFFIPRPAKHDRNARDHTVDFLLDSHNTLVDALVSRAQKMYAGLNLYDHRHRIPGSDTENYTGKLLIIRDTVLKEASRTPENQLFLASNGFGCDPNASGRKVFGKFLIDGEETVFNRGDFIGVVDEKYLADWAKEKLADLQDTTAPEEAEGQSMPGMKGI